MPPRRADSQPHQVANDANAIRTLPRGESGYPDGLEDLPDAPESIYARGIIPNRSECVAIVGARAATPYGVRVAGALARDLASVGFTVVSGLARGIDAAAHRGALECGGTTVAVLPAGLDHVTPPHHRGLAEQIAARRRAVFGIRRRTAMGTGCIRAAQPVDRSALRSRRGGGGGSGERRAVDRAVGA